MEGDGRMTTIFVPVQITSAEQAAALPIGTISIDADAPGLVPAEVSTKEEDGLWYGQITAPATNADMVGEFALVPIEAEDEWAPMAGDRACVRGTQTEAYVRDAVSDMPGARVGHRLVTPWSPETESSR
jgi:hypothetical protein